MAADSRLNSRRNTVNSSRTPRVEGHGPELKQTLSKTGLNVVETNSSLASASTISPRRRPKYDKVQSSILSSKQGKYI